MGRKKQVPDQADLIPPDKVEEKPPDEPKVKTSDIIRESLAAGNTSPVNALAWAKEHYPNITFNEASFKSGFSSLKNKDKPDEERHTRATKSQVNAQAMPGLFAQPNEPTISDLRRLAQLAKERETSVEELLKQVQGVSDLASEVGGFDKLLKGLAALHDFTGLK